MLGEGHDLSVGDDVNEYAHVYQRRHGFTQRSTWLKRDGTRVEDDWLRRIGPAHFSHINFRGTNAIRDERFAAALIQRGPVYQVCVAS